MVLITSVLLRVFILRKTRRAVMCAQLLPGADKAKRHLSQLIDMSMLHDERCGKRKCSPGISLVGDSQHAFRDSGTRACGRPRKVPVALWNCVTHVGDCSVGFMQCQETFQNLFHECCLSTGGCRCSPSFSHVVKPRPWLVADGMHPRALTQIYSSGPPWYAPKHWHVVRSLMRNDWPDHC